MLLVQLKCTNINVLNSSRFYHLYVILLNRYELMKKCWNSDPNQRQSFSEIEEDIDKYLSQHAGYIRIENPFNSQTLMEQT